MTTDPKKIYDDQLKAITNIAHTDWYKEIKAFFQRELDWTKAEYPFVKEDDLHRLQEKDKVVTKFLTYLSNLEQAQNIQAQAKVSN